MDKKKVVSNLAMFVMFFLLIIFISMNVINHDSTPFSLTESNDEIHIKIVGNRLVTLNVFIDSTDGQILLNPSGVDDESNFFYVINITTGHYNNRPFSVGSAGFFLKLVNGTFATGSFELIDNGILPNLGVILYTFPVFVVILIFTFINITFFLKKLEKESLEKNIIMFGTVNMIFLLFTPLYEIWSPYLLNFFLRQSLSSNMIYFLFPVVELGVLLLILLYYYNFKDEKSGFLTGLGVTATVIGFVSLIFVIFYFKSTNLPFVRSFMIYPYWYTILIAYLGGISLLTGGILTLRNRERLRSKILQ